MQTFIEILKYGSKHDMVSYQSLFEYLIKNSFTFYPGERLTEHNSTLKNVFRKYYADSQGNPPADVHSGFYYLTSEGFSYLLNYESLEFAKREAKEAKETAVTAIKQGRTAVWIAIASILLSTLFSILQMVLK